MIPKELIDPNAVLELNAGTFPQPNFGTTQYISSIPQPTNVREDVVRIDHTINSKLQLMGHYLHDGVTQTYYPPLWGDGTYPTVGTAMLNPSWSATIKLTQTLSPNLLNETAFLYSGNTIHLTPVGISRSHPGGQLQVSSRRQQCRKPHAGDRTGRTVQHKLEFKLLPLEELYKGYEIRDDLSWNKGGAPVQIRLQLAARSQESATTGKYPGHRGFQQNSFSGDSYINFLLGDTATFTQLQFLAGKHWVNNNYGFYANDNWHIIPRLTLNLGLRYRRIASCL